MPAALGRSPVTIACRPKPKEIELPNCQGSADAVRGEANHVEPPSVAAHGERSTAWFSRAEPTTWHRRDAIRIPEIRPLARKGSRAGTAGRRGGAEAEKRLHRYDFLPHAVWNGESSGAKNRGSCGFPPPRLAVFRRSASHGGTRKRLADCGTSLPPQDAATADRRKPRLFDRSAKWTKAMDGFVHGQLAVQGR